MPIRSPRVLVEIEEITRNLDDNPDAIDTAPDQTVNGLKSNIFVKMKKGIAKYLGLEPIAWNDPRLLGVFGGSGLNQGAEYERQLGGFRHASFKLVSKTQFLIEEEYWDNVNKNLVVETGAFRTMNIGLPKGWSVNEFKTFLAGSNNFDNIAAFVTPAGRKIDIYEPLSS